MRKDLLEAAVPERMHPKLTGLVEAWDSGDGIVRRELLATLFCGIHVSQGAVVGYSPSPQRQTQVMRLLETVRRKLSVNVGGDGFEPTASSV